MHIIKFIEKTKECKNNNKEEDNKSFYFIKATGPSREETRMQDKKLFIKDQHS